MIGGGADSAVLDTYQTEREPHVRGYVDMAIGMGRMVCTLDPAAAEARDAGMLALRKARVAPPPPPTPKPGRGLFLDDSPGAASLFAQPWAGGGEQTAKLDDVLGEGAWLIGRGRFTGALSPVLHYHDLDGPALARFRDALASWLDFRGAQGVLVRADRYVFGAGSPTVLSEAFSRALATPKTWSVAA